MGRPTKEELDHALMEAGRMREQNEDPDHLAKCLLNHNYRLKQLEQLYSQVELYLHSGQDESEHRHLIKLLDKLRSEDRHPGLDSHRNHILPYNQPPK